jgi:plasmid stability protein
MPKIIQVRDVPDDVHRALKARAAAEGRTLSDLVRAELLELAERPSLATMLRRLAEREPVTTGESSVDAVRAGRSER